MEPTDSRGTMTLHTVSRIAVLGPESTGKSSLCASLAEQFGGLWLPEYAREFLTALNRTYQRADLEIILREQLRREDDLAATNPRVLFCDTEAINFKVWMEDVYGESELWIDELISPVRYRMYLLTYPDLPWTFDPLRENPERSLYFFNWYQTILDAWEIPYAIIRGEGETRLQNAVEAVTRLTGLSPVR